MEAMTAKEWERRLKASRWDAISTGQVRKIIADLAAAEERAERAEKARKEIEDCFLQGKVPLGISMPQIDALAAKLAEETRTLDNCREGHEAATEAISQLNEEVDEIKAKLEDAEETIIGLREKDRDRDISYTIMGEREEKALKAYEDAAQELHETQGKLEAARLDVGRLREALVDAAGAVKWGAIQAGERRVSPDGIEMFRSTLARIQTVLDAALATPADGLWEKLKPYLRHKEGCEALGVHTDDCTCGLEALMGGEK